ncbi:MAG TPA: ABC transporter permease [Bryobacteraceae bacterium]|nr:ABC transporter permease [Bryobacteraceae bacterium]
MSIPVLDLIWRDVRSAARSLLRAPLAAAVMISILALGIGLNTAVYSILYGILLRPYPYASPERIVRIASAPVKDPGIRVGVSLPDFEDFRRDARTVQELSAWTTERINLIDTSAAVPVDAGVISAGLFAALGVKLAMGREFLPEEDIPGGDVNKIVLSNALWKTRFHADAGILGQVIRTSLGSFTVVGVASPGFLFPRDSALWIPIESELRARNGSRGQRFYRKYRVIARLREGASLQAAKDDLRQIGTRLQQEQAPTNREILPVVEPLRTVETSEMRPYILLLMGGAGLVLLVCCTNLANLLLARSAARAREFAVRSAMGAGRKRILIHLLIEHALLAVLGAALGTALADGLLAVLPRMIPTQLPFWIHFDLDRNVLAFTCAVTVGTVVVFGLAPLLKTSRDDLEGLLREGSRGSSATSRLRRGLIIGEVALSAVLLVCAGLLLKSLNRLERIEPGFQPRNVLVVQLSPFKPGPAQQRIEAATVYFRRVIDRIAAVPGVVAVGATDGLPYADASDRPSYNMEVRGEGSVERAYRGPGSVVDITPRYFDALGIPLLQGRAFNDQDQSKSEKVIILSERAAKFLFPGRSPLGGQVRHNTNGMADPWSRVVGVVGNVRYKADETADGMEMYFPSAQWEFESAYVAIRFQGTPEGFENAVRQAVISVDSETGIDEMKSMESLMNETLWQQRSWGYVLAGFAAATLLLAAVGLYGVMSYSVALRRTEIGIRAALGATPRTIFGEITREGIGLAAAGTAVGLVAALGVTRLLRSMLYGVPPSDPITFGLAAAVLIAVAALASALPGWRAASVDPVKILRN